MTFRGIHHIGVAVRNLEESLSAWAALFGGRPGLVEVNPERKVRLALLRFDQGPAVEFVSPLDKESTVARFLERRGEGIHHFAVDVDDIESAMAELRRSGLAFVSEAPLAGMGGSRVAFIRPESLNGVLLELRETRETG